jgi:two-component system, LytTR family, response regulator
MRDPSRRMAITALLVDDEPLARKRMRKLLRAYEDVVVAGEAGGGDEALRFIAERRPQVVFLDVQMPRMDGFEVVRRIDASPRPLIVFVTAYERYALDAFRASAVQYLVKPVAQESLGLAMTRVRELVAVRSDAEMNTFLAKLQERTTYMHHVAVKSKGQLRLVPVDQIDWFESAGNYVRLHVAGERFLLRQTMSGLEEKLDPREFVRIHRTAIVNLKRIQDLRPASHGEHVVILKGGTQLVLSRVYRERIDALRGSA